MEVVVVGRAWYL
jgi:hypothetical protein